MSYRGIIIGIATGIVLAAAPLSAQWESQWQEQYESTLKCYQQAADQQNEWLDAGLEQVRRIETMTPEQIEVESRRTRALLQMYSGMNTSYQLQGQIDAGTARMQSSFDYLQETGDTFNQNYRPDSDSSNYDSWQYTNNIYNIWQ